MDQKLSLEPDSPAGLARVGNLLGAVAIGLGDAIRDGCRAAVNGEGASPAAISVLGALPGISVATLSRILEMSHPGAVRLLEGLAEAHLVDRRRSAADLRTAELHLTEKGQAARAKILCERHARLQTAFAGLSGVELEQFGKILEKILVSLPRDELHCATICRFCDEVSCIDCPLAAAFGAEHGKHA